MSACAVHGGEIAQSAEHYIDLVTCFQIEKWVLCPDCAHSILRQLEPSEHKTDNPLQ